MQDSSDLTIDKHGFSVDVKFYHLIIGGHCGEKPVSVTFAVHETANNIFVAMALCSPKDQFSKKRGRLISYGRLMKSLSGTHLHKYTCMFIKMEGFDLASAFRNILRYNVSTSWIIHYDVGTLSTR